MQNDQSDTDDLVSVPPLTHRESESDEKMDEITRECNVDEYKDNCVISAEDYEMLSNDSVDEIAEDTPEKQIRLKDMIAGESTGKYGASYLTQSRWIGILEK